jgi:hypothetical protein
MTTSSRFVGNFNVPQKVKQQTRLKEMQSESEDNQEELRHEHQMILKDFQSAR